ncbi:MAG: ATP-binding cassette domain-containing protein [Bifidobacterium sp.]|jgi:peptide/nickel transport system ATP-binding protein|nr:ATP-binding cassette domain-containing protein [Bifidobacterium sp.]MCI1865407.1 ATP-binding cassette domain-containing protein [Bifidobacterium sp.]
MNDSRHEGAGEVRPPTADFGGCADSSVVLEGVSISKGYGSRGSRRQVLSRVDIRAMRGRCLGLIGGSGSGKSTLMRIVLGLESPDGGVVRFRGEVLAGRSCDGARRRLRMQSGLVFQNPHGSLDPRWPVWRSVAEPLTVGAARGDRSRIVRRVEEALASVGLDPEEFMGRYPCELSGGQAQRVAIARATVNDPALLVADEPMSALDVVARERIMDTFASIRAHRPELAMILISHDLGIVRTIADDLLVLHHGEVQETGVAADVLDAPRSPYTRRLIEAASL